MEYGNSIQQLSSYELQFSRISLLTRWKGFKFKVIKFTVDTCLLNLAWLGWPNLEFMSSQFRAYKENCSSVDVQYQYCPSHRVNNSSLSLLELKCHEWFQPLCQLFYFQQKLFKQWQVMWKFKIQSLHQTPQTSFLCSISETYVLKVTDICGVKSRFLSDVQFVQFVQCTVSV